MIVVKQRTIVSVVATELCHYQEHTVCDLKKTSKNMPLDSSQQTEGLSINTTLITYCTKVVLKIILMMMI